MPTTVETTAQTLLRLASAYAEGPVPDPSAEVDLQDMGLDSLAIALLLTEIEAEFGIKLPPEETAQVTTFDQLVQLVDKVQNGVHG